MHLPRPEAERRLRQALSDPQLHALCLDSEPDREVLITMLAPLLMSVFDEGWEDGWESYNDEWDLHGGMSG